MRLLARYGADYLPANPHFDEAALTYPAHQLRVDLAERIQSSFAHGTLMPMGAGLGVETGRPVIAVFGEPVVADTLPARYENLKLSDVRYRVDFRATVPARSLELAWRLTTAGVKDIDPPDSRTLAHPDKVDREDLARASYAVMRMEGTNQIRDRLQLDF